MNPVCLQLRKASCAQKVPRSRAGHLALKKSRCNQVFVGWRCSNNATRDWLRLFYSIPFSVFVYYSVYFVCMLKKNKPNTKCNYLQILFRCIDEPCLLTTVLQSVSPCSYVVYTSCWFLTYCARGIKGHSQPLLVCPLAAEISPVSLLILKLL